MLKTVGIVLLCFGAFALAEEKVPSKCENDRAARLNVTVTESIVFLIPECEENGDYAAKQCFKGNNWCVCYNRVGDNLNTPSKNVKSCGCLRAKEDAVTNGESYVPSCHRYGHYQKKQCQRDECWCVDEQGNVLDDPRTGDVTCS